MYETETNGRHEPLDQLPAEIARQFAGLTDRILSRTTLAWGEHCTECVWPTCYTTCDLYSPREDGRCRRFVHGMVRLDHPQSPNSYILKITFKRWGKLWAAGDARLYDREEALRRERRDYFIGSCIHHLPVPRFAKSAIQSLRYNQKKTSRAQNSSTTGTPTFFIVECYNPSDRTVFVTLTLRTPGARQSRPYQKLLDVSPGYKCFRVPVDEIPPALLQQRFEVELVPNDIDDGTVLYFGLMDFVREKASDAPVKTVKCVVWDLDNTLWDGVLVEDGPSRLQLKPGVADLIRALDERGILNSIASKNSYDDAWPVVQKFGLDQYFLVPQISWSPKGDAIKNIAAQLNIGIDSILFVDDSRFELEQVKSSCPDVRVLDASEYATLLTRPECQVPVTAEASNRRKMYQAEALRKDVAAKFDGDYFQFLRECALELEIGPLTQDNIERVHELTQRTNQMNFSGTRYTRQVLDTLRSSKTIDSYVLSCHDKFGSYGVVGFCVVDRREPRMTDLMFSCRIQSKRVEHAFLAHLIRRYFDEFDRDFWANYRKTPRNEPSGRVFADLGFEEVSVEDGVTSLVFRRERAVPDDQIVSIKDRCRRLESSPA